MLTLYLVTLITGGVLVGVSVLAGAFDFDLDTDTDADLDADVDADADLDHGGLGDALAAWMPVASLRFWTVFAAFFGLTGVLLHAVGGELSEAMIAGISVGTGWLSGVFTTRLVARLKRQRVDSAARPDDWLGETGRVLVAVTPEHPGKVRLLTRGRFVDLFARPLDRAALPAGSSCVVADVDEDGTLAVLPAD